MPIVGFYLFCAKQFLKYDIREVADPLSLSGLIIIMILVKHKGGGRFYPFHHKVWRASSAGIVFPIPDES